MASAKTTQDASRLRPADPVLLAVLFGVSAGIVHVLVVMARRHWWHTFTWTSRDIVWMSPLGNVLLLLVPALLLAAAAAVRSRFATWRVAVTLLAFASLTGIGLLVRGLHWAAVLAIALGVAVQVGAWTGKRGGQLRGRFVRWALGLAVIVVVTDGAARWTRRAHPASEPPVAGAPNVLLVVLDAVRTKSLGAYGSARSATPALDALAREGAVFDRAYVAAPWTLPSHASMFTGRAASELSTSWRRPFDGAYPTVAEAFRRQGYATGAFVGNTFYTHHESGIGRGFDVLRDFDVSLSQVLRSTTLIQTPTMLGILNARTLFDVRKAIRYFDLSERSEPENDRRLSSEVLGEFQDWRATLGGRPFFAFVNLFDAHDPYSPPSPWGRRFGTDKEGRYDGGIGYMDAMLDSTLRQLATSGQLDRTIVVVTADHGEQFGEHGLHNHGNSLYLPLVHVPLIVRYPARVAAQTRVRRVVSLRDLGATLVDLAGLGHGSVAGTSLAAVTDGGAGVGEALTETEKTDGGGRDHPAAHGNMASLVNDSLHLILNGDGRAELYAYVADPEEGTDLAATPAWCGALRAMLTRLRHQSAFARRAPERKVCPPPAPASAQ